MPKRIPSFRLNSRTIPMEADADNTRFMQPETWNLELIKFGCPDHRLVHTRQSPLRLRTHDLIGCQEETHLFSHPFPAGISWMATIRDPNSMLHEDEFPAWVRSMRNCQISISTHQHGVPWLSSPSRRDAGG